MELIADGLLFIATLVAGLYCLVLSRRLRQMTQTEGGIGKAVTVLNPGGGDENRPRHIAQGDGNRRRRS